MYVVENRFFQKSAIVKATYTSNIKVFFTLLMYVYLCGQIAYYASSLTPGRPFYGSPPAGLTP